MRFVINLGGSSFKGNGRRFVLNYMTRLILAVGIAVAVSFLYMNPASLQAQTVSGTILGQIQDQQGAAIGKVQITAKSLDTGAIRTATADDSGAYRITSVPAGSYEVSAAIAGFKTEVRSGISVTVGADIGVNFSLTVGAVSEKVEVTAEAAQVDTSSSTLGGFVNSATIRELPLNGRDWLQLALLQPGVNLNNAQNQADGSRSQRGNGIAISISGGRPTDNAFRIDGLIVNDYSNAGPGSALRVNMGVDAIREFSVLTNSYSAEYGRGSGGIVNAITKSGTNEYHGSAYYFHRNSALDARNFFDNGVAPGAKVATIPPFRRHQYGGAVGGVIRKDKTFFFSNYEALHEIKSLSTSDPTISVNARNGILCSNPPSCTTTEQITVDPRIKPFLTLYPIPNGQVTGNIGKFLFGPKRKGDENYIIGKVDHYFSAATTLAVSYTYDDASVISPDNYDLKSSLAPSTRQNGVVTLQHIFSSSLINNTRVGISRTFAGNAIDVDPRNPALTDLAYSFLPGIPFGQIQIGGITSGLQGVPSGIGASGTSRYGYTAPQLFNDLSWTKGRHSIRTGFNIERIYHNSMDPQKTNGQWTFDSVKQFLLNIPSQFLADFPGTDPFRSVRMSMVGAYIQDDFRLRPNLTINLGVRYEAGTVVTEAHGRMAQLRYLTDPKVTLGTPYYNNPTLKNFAPRAGFAWDPFKDGKTSVRGGFGMFDVVPLPFLFNNRMPRSTPFFQNGILNTTSSALFPNKALPFLSPSTLLTSHIEFNPHRAYRMQWNLNVQRQLNRTLALTLGYVGSSAVHIVHQLEDFAQVPPSLARFDSALSSYIFPGRPIPRINTNFGAIRSTEWNGQSNYHAMQANLVQRPVRGLMYQIAYTWSKSIDNGSTTWQGGNESGNSISEAWAFCNACNRGVGDFNVPHNFVLNFLYDVPTFAAVKKSALANTILGGWQVGGIYIRQTGGPFTLRIANDQALTGNSQTGGQNGGQRPQLLGHLPGCASPTTNDLDHYVNTSCFAFPALGQLGNEGRNIMRMPAFRDLDFSVFKNQNLLGERLKAQFRVEMFNILNNTNLTAQLQTIFDGTGKLVPSVGTPVGPTANTSRQIQLGLRLIF